MFPQLARFTNLGLFLMRLLVAVIFIGSGYFDLKDPAGRGQSLGLSKTATVLLGLAELAGGLAVAVGFLTQLAAIGLILIMLGAVSKKLFVWHTGFWGPNKTDGAHYDLMLAVMCLVILFTDGGEWVLMR